MQEFFDKLTDAEKDRLEEILNQYMLDAHGVQSGIAFTMNHNPDLTTPKHMRVGIDTGKADMEGLVTLLLRKGVFGYVEYHEAIAESMNRERERWEAEASAMLGSKVDLR